MEPEAHPGQHEEWRLTVQGHQVTLAGRWFSVIGYLVVTYW